MNTILRPLHSARGFWPAVSLVCALTLTSGAVHAASLPACEAAVLTLTEAADLVRVDSAELRQLAEHNEVPARLVGTSWRFNCAAVMAWLNGDWALIASAARDAPSRSLPPLPTQAMAEVTGRQTGTGSAANASPPVEDEPIGEAPEDRTAEDIFLRSQRVLLGPGEYTLDIGQFYAEGNSQLLASVDGAGVLASAEQEGFITTLQGRLGVGEETELFAGTSYFNQDSDVFFGNRKLASSDRSDFGDVSFGVRHTFMREGPGRPNMIGTLSGRIPTGDTSYAIGGGLAFVKSIDPVALFASVNYTHTFSEDFADVALLEPEDRIDASIGYALALNDTLSLSTSISAVFTSATGFPDTELRQRDGYRLGFGFTSWLAPGLYIEPSVSFSLGGPDDSFAFGLSVFTFPP